MKVTRREGGSWGWREGRRGAAKIQRSAGSLKFDFRLPGIIFVRSEFWVVRWGRASKGSLDVNALDERLHCKCAILGGCLSVFLRVCVFFGMFGCVFGDRKWVFECVWMCVCVECVICYFSGFFNNCRFFILSPKTFQHIFGQMCFCHFTRKIFFVQQ